MRLSATEMGGLLTLRRLRGLLTLLLPGGSTGRHQPFTERTTLAPLQTSGGWPSSNPRFPLLATGTDQAGSVLSAIAKQACYRMMLLIAGTMGLSLNL
jgi:hypothetical protein